MDARENEMSGRRFDREEYASPAPGRGYSAVESDDPERIRAEIDRTRRELDATVCELQSRLTLQHLMEQGKHKVKDRVRGRGVPLALIGAGVAWMMVDRNKRKNQQSVQYVPVPVGRPDEIGRGRDRDWLAPGAQYWERRGGSSGPGIGERIGERAHEVKDRIRDRASSLTDRASGMAGEVRDRATEYGSIARERVSEFADEARTRAERLASDARHTAHRAQEGFWDTYDNNPLLLGAGGLALGLAMGVAVPTTRAENKLMGETSDELARKARRLGREAVDRGQKVAERVIDKAQSGEVADKAKELATSVAGIAKDEVKAERRDAAGNGYSGGGGAFTGDSKGGNTGGSGSSQFSSKPSAKTGQTGPGCPPGSDPVI